MKHRFGDFSIVIGVKYLGAICTSSKIEIDHEGVTLAKLISARITWPIIEYTFQSLHMEQATKHT